MEKTCRDGGVFGALLTDLSIVFQCIQHEFIIVKLKACGFHSDTLKLIHDYLPNTQQRVKPMMDIVHGKNILWCSTGIHNVLLAIQYTAMWPNLLFGDITPCKLCGCY